MNRSRWMLLGVLATLACDSPFGVDTDDLPLVLTLQEYTFEVKGENPNLRLFFGYEFVNSTKKVLYISNPSYQREPLFERLVGEEWVPVAGPGGLCLAALVTSTAIPRGKVYSGYTEREWDEGWVQGTYRVVLGGIVSETDERLFPVGESIPERLRTSSPFEVIVP